LCEKHTSAVIDGYGANSNRYGLRWMCTENC